MALQINHKDITFGVGDTIRVTQKIVESGKSRSAIFEGMVIGIKGTAGERTFTVRKIGVQKVGIEQIFPLLSPSIEKIEIKRKGVEGSRHAKLYFTRTKSRREIEAIYSRANRKDKPAPKKSKAKKASK